MTVGSFIPNSLRSFQSFRIGFVFSVIPNWFRFFSHSELVSESLFWLNKLEVDADAEMNSAEFSMTITP